MTRSIIMAGNWKMYKTVGESLALVEELREALAAVGDREIVVCPPFTKYSALRLFLSYLNIFIFVNENRINKCITIQNYDCASQ